MAHNIKAAIEDLKQSFEGLSWKPVVKLEDQEQGSKEMVTIVPAGMDEEFRFGEVKRLHTLSVKVYLSAKSTTPQVVQQRLADLNNCMILDRKRGGNALTTVTASWSDETNDGRQGVVMVSEPQIHVIESC